MVRLTLSQSLDSISRPCLHQGAPMFTLALSDKPVAVTNAAKDEARDLFMSNEFRQDLRALESEGAPLWDGFAT
jgi:hypothetical protein